MRGITSTHHLDKSLLPKMAPSSSSAKIIPVHAGVVIKEKGTKLRSSWRFWYETLGVSIDLLCRLKLDKKILSIKASLVALLETKIKPSPFQELNMFISTLSLPKCCWFHTVRFRVCNHQFNKVIPNLEAQCKGLPPLFVVKDGGSYLLV